MNTSSSESIPRLCPCCDQRRLRVLLRWESRYTIMACRACGLRFCDPMPSEEELTRFYQGFLFRKPQPGGLQAAVRRRKHELVRAFGRETIARGGSFLDYGGGTGAGIAAARELGLDTWYFDLDREAAVFVRETFGLPADRFLSTATLSGKTFRLILADNVIEHVPDPVSVLAHLYSMLEPGGTLVIKTPAGGNTTVWFYPLVSLAGYTARAWRSAGAREAVRCWFFRPWHCDPPRHLWSFTGTSMIHLAYKAGIPAGNITVRGYALPLFEYSITTTMLNLTRGGRLGGSAVRLMAATPLIPLECALKGLQIMLAVLGILSDPGVLCRVVKSKAD